MDSDYFFIKPVGAKVIEIIEAIIITIKITVNANPKGRGILPEFVRIIEITAPRRPVSMKVPDKGTIFLSFILGFPV